MKKLEYFVKQKLFKDKLFFVVKFVWYVLSLINRDLKAPTRISFAKRVWLWKHGFFGESSLLYSLNELNIKNYVSDYDRFFRTQRINDEFSCVLDNKLVFSNILSDYKDYLPKVYGFMNQGLLITTNHTQPLIGKDYIVDVCIRDGFLVVKPIDGSNGENIFIIKSVNKKLFVNNSRTTVGRVSNFLSKLNNYIVMEYIQQHSYASAIFSPSTNTIRMLTVWDYDKKTPIIAIAIHRFGRNSTIPVDNWSQGGLSCLIDQETGTLGPGVSFPTAPKLVWHEVHPDTKAQIAGVTVPNWTHVKSKILEMAKQMPFTPYIGWDIVITSDSFKVIEGNNNSDVNLLQIHFPLLSDPRVKRFYASEIG